MYSQQKL